MVYKELNSTGTLIRINHGGSSDMYYIGLDVHKKTISYCVKDASGQVHRHPTRMSYRRQVVHDARRSRLSRSRSEFHC